MFDCDQCRPARVPADTVLKLHSGVTTVFKSRLVRSSISSDRARQHRVCSGLAAQPCTLLTKQLLIWPGDYFSARHLRQLKNLVLRQRHSGWVPHRTRHFCRHRANRLNGSRQSASGGHAFNAAVLGGSVIRSGNRHNPISRREVAGVAVRSPQGLRGASGAPREFWLRPSVDRPSTFAQELRPYGEHAK